MIHVHEVCTPNRVLRRIEKIMFHVLEVPVSFQKKNVLPRVLYIAAVIFSALFLPAVLYSQSGNFSPEKISFEKIATPGVSNTLLEDQNGFLWVGTDVGLWRYDGYGFKSYSHIVPERIDTGMFQDSRGLIWIGTESGLIAFDPLTEKRTTYTQDSDNPNSLSNHVFQYKKHTICEDTQRHLWIATDDGLNMFDRTNSTFTVYTRKNSGLIDNYITAILPARDGMLWVATFNGLQKFDPVQGKVVSYYPGAPSNMYTLAEDSNGKLWIGAYFDGLYVLHPDVKKFTIFQHDPDDPASLSSNIVTYILISPDMSEKAWVATLDGGLNLIEMETGKIHHFRADSDCPQKQGLSGNALSHIVQDRMGALFVLNEHGFLNRIDPGTERFTTLVSVETGTENVPQASAYSVWDDAMGNVWMVAGKNRVSRYETESGMFRFVAELPDDIRGMIAADENGTMWMAGGGYIAQFDPARSRIVSTIDVAGLRLSGLRDATDQNVLWFGSANVGLVKVNTEEKTVKYIIPEDSSASAAEAKQMVMRLILSQDQDGMIWISTFGVGLQRFDPNSEEITGTYFPLEIHPGNPSGFFRDSKGRCWVSFQNSGPALFDPDTGVFQHFETISHYPWPARGSTGILEDSSGTLWISGNGSGEIVRFNPDTKVVKLYTIVDGVAPGTSDTLNRQPVISSDGAFWFSGMGGVTRFHPQDITDNLYRPPVYLTQLTQDGTPLDTIGDIISGQTLILPPDSNFFEFEAVALNFRLSERNRYQYRLIGRDEKWFDAGTRRQGHYSGLDEGMYILEVRGANNDGVWSKEPARLNIYVEPDIQEDIRLFSLNDIRAGKGSNLKFSENNLMFEAAPLDFTILENQHYAYKLLGYDADWKKIDGSRYITYKKVPEGRYVFKILNGMTAGEYGLPITIRPPVYKSWWFLSLIFFIIAGVSGSFYRQRIVHLNREKEEAIRHHCEEKQLEQEKMEAIDARLAAVVARENAVEALREREKRYRDLLATMTEGFIILDSQGILTYANNRFCEMLGYPLTDITRTVIVKLLDEQNKAVFDEHMEKQQRGDMTTYELQWIRSDSQRITTLISSRPLMDPSGGLLESFAVITDISELKKTEAMLRTREQELIREKSNLEEVNTALKVLLRKREEDIEEVKGRLNLNLKKLVMPYVERIDTDSLDEQHAMLLNIITSNLADITSEFSQKLGTRYADLSNMEIQIAHLIREGKSSKEIAHVFNISERTVEFHRANIRKKLGMKGNNVNLQAYLQQF